MTKRFVVIEGDPVHLGSESSFLVALMGDTATRAVVDMTTPDLVYPFGDIADEAAEAFNTGSRSFDGYLSAPMTALERSQLEDVLATGGAE